MWYALIKVIKKRRRNEEKYRISLHLIDLGYNFGSKL